MNNNHFLVKFLFCISFFQLISGAVSAQCDNITLNTTVTPSTCSSNGSVKVTIGGSDAPNLRQDDMQFLVEGTISYAWGHYQDNTISNLPAGTYKISLRAFCNAANNGLGGWVVASQTKTVTVTTNYNVMDAILGTPRKTLNCIHTGMIPITIKPNTGSSPFTVILTNTDSGYSGQDTFTFVRASVGSTLVMQIENLPAGNYTFDVVDNCSTTQTIHATVGTMSQDYSTDMFHSNLYPASNSTDCDMVAVSRTTTSSWDNDEFYYFYSYSYLYFEFGYQVNSGPITWIGSDTIRNSRINVRLPYDIKTFRGTNSSDRDTIKSHIRLKESPTCQHFIKNSIIYTPYPNLNYKNLTCSHASVFHYTYPSHYYGVFCLPYKWRIVSSDRMTVVKDWSAPISTVNSSYEKLADSVPYGSLIEYEDNLGYTWSRQVMSAPRPSTPGSSLPCINYGITNSTFHSYVYIYFPNVDSIPAGTRIKFVSGPISPPLANQDVTLPKATPTFYPFSANYTQSEYVYMPAGIYRFEVTLPGSNCTTESATFYHSPYVIKTPLSYTTKETCGGLTVYPTGQIGYIKYQDSITGTKTDYSTFYYVSSVTPSSIPVDKIPVAQGDSLFFPSSGRYIFGMTYYKSGTGGGCLAQTDTIDYEKTLFQLNSLVTTAHVCEDATLGFIRVAGMGGSGNYMYQLYDKGQFVTENDSGIFLYGLADSTYMIRLIDVDPNCAASYDQEVKLIDLGIAQIAYSSSPTNRFCLQDSIYLKCITLGETTYEWTGPGITAANKNLQNPAIAAFDPAVGFGSHTYTVTVKPEGCGSVMSQSITLVVEDCTGARDDYHTMFVNTTDSIDVLENDAYRASCWSSVTPVITVSPLHGTARVANKKVIYTPTTNFLGRDSLTYSTVCNGETTYAKVYITVIDYPDNIVDADCYVDPVGFNWAIKQDFMSTQTNVSTYVPPLVGDLDGDGIPEILVGRYRSDGAYARLYDGIYIYWGTDRANPTFVSTVSGNFDDLGFSIAKVYIGGTLRPIIVMFDNEEGYLYAYDPDPLKTTEAQSRIWKSSHPLNNYNKGLNQYSIGFADFDGDGNVEIYAGTRIFDASTGVFLAEIPAGGNQGKITSPGASYVSYTTVAADVTNDGIPELIAATEVYSVHITNRSGTVGNQVTLIASLPPVTIGAFTLKDGNTSVADINLDGRLDIVVNAHLNQIVGATTGRYGVIAWDVQTQTLIAKSDPIERYSRIGHMFIGNIDDEPNLEILFTTNTLNTAGAIHGFRWDGADRLDKVYSFATTDRSGMTTITLFDFNHDDKMELVYRDETHLRIMEADKSTGTFTNLVAIPATSGTSCEFPVVADIDNDGSAEIVATGGTMSGSLQGTLRIYRSGNEYNWASARPVWNQFNYNVVNVNDDLTIPRYQMNPATVFPGPDGILGTTDDVRPYNNFLQQQTTLYSSGKSIWLAPDVYPDPTLTSTTIAGDSVCITVGIINEGEAAIGPPVYVALYKESVSPSNFLFYDSLNIQILPGDTGYVDVRIPDIGALEPMLNMAFRVNDNGVKFMYFEECDSTDNVLIIQNPALHLYMEKDAELTIKPSLSTIAYNGTRPNPVAILFGEEIEYTITGLNVSLSQHTMVIEDTIPAYLKYVTNTATTGSDIVFNSYLSQMVGMTEYDILKWTITNVGSMDTRVVTFKATPRSGVCSSQPEFMNRAWVTVNTNIRVPTNYTYHQGACVGFATFSSGIGGVIHNAAEQALDYMTSPRSGIVVVPDDGYRFVGWSHGDYISLRGERVEAASGIMQYDTLTVFGNVELHANFALEEYPIRYHLNEGKNAEDNPPVYTIESGAIELAAPTKPNDVFTGWTGSNGDTPQTSVVIPKGSTGELDFYANYLHSGRESDDVVDEYTGDDRIWSVHDELYIRTSKVGALVRVYTLEGILQKVHTITVAGDTKLKLPRGLYIVTLDNGIGQKVIIE